MNRLAGEACMVGREPAAKQTNAGGRTRSPSELIRHDFAGRDLLYEEGYDLGGEDFLAVAVGKGDTSRRLSLITNLTGPLLLHWGFSSQRNREWALPPPETRPPDTVEFDGAAVQTPFLPREDGFAGLQLDLPVGDLPAGICFVLHEPDTGRWLKDGARNFYVPIDDPLYLGDDPGEARLAALADAIVSAETSTGSWTLMHRFNLCHDLLDRVTGNVHGWALLFVWLRYSAIRQLDWQRNYNTKPKEVAHAMDRLTRKLADAFPREPAGRELIRLMFTTLGRGGQGQRIRDEILEIMHRHHVKEVSGHFLEEWHQKLHNNTTPDDIVICEAFLAFLRNEGDLASFYRTLEQGGVTRDRLERYERPIRSEPDLVPHSRDGLIRDFEHFLGTLRAVHGGVDLQTAVHESSGLLDGSFDDLLAFVLHHRADGAVPAPRLAERIFEARGRIDECLDQGHEVRDLLFLDLALESTLRVRVEQALEEETGPEARTDLIRWALENFLLAHPMPEIELCLRQWRVLARAESIGREWALEAGAAAERTTRGLSGFGKRLGELLQPKADLLGRAFGADRWAVELFSEEVVRGTLASALSNLLHLLQPALRKAADLGDWQVVSPGRGAGRLEVVHALETIQGRPFERPVVILTERLSGYEEIPKGVAGILTPAGVDALSHLAIRARNGHVPFAVCYSPGRIDGLRHLQGTSLRVCVGGAGDVTVEPGEAEEAQVPAPSTAAPPKPAVRPSRGRVLSLGEFEEGRVGWKSLNLRRLADGLPSSISVPRSAALPFGVFEKVREQEANREAAERYDRLAAQVEEGGAQALEELRQVVLSLEAPQGWMDDLLRRLAEAGIPQPADPGEAWTCIKRVWASSWNERACLSRRARGICHGDFRMAVLVQEVVDAEYAFVLHTADPISGNRDELYAEVVLGLGETLVGNHPGSALRFTCPKEEPVPRILACPSKSVGLYGRGLIFRSDSSGEDLAGYAGAGLYDSFLLEPPAEVRLDYAEERLLRDGGFLREFAFQLTRVGVTIENLFGAPQDIEGAYAGGRVHVVQTRPQVGIPDG